MLIAHDDPSFRVQLASILPASEYEVDEVRQDETLLDSLRRRAFDLVVLGIKTRGVVQVVERCRRVRELSPVIGLILVSSGKVEEGDGDRRADGLEAGADDYITATVESREFLARIRAVLRRTRWAEPAHRVVRVGGLEIDLDRRSLRQNATPIHLTRREFDLLALMMQKPGASFTHSQLRRSVWGPDYGGELEYLRPAFACSAGRSMSIRRKPSCIRTVPGVGYCFQGTLDL